MQDHRTVFSFDRTTDGFAVKHPVCLRSSRAHCWSFSRVEPAELDAGPVCRLGHNAAQGIDFFDDVSFADTPNSGVAGHLSHGFDSVCDQKRFRASTRRGQRRLGPGMAAANHDHIKRFGILHRWETDLRISPGSSSRIDCESYW